MRAQPAGKSVGAARDFPIQANSGSAGEMHKLRGRCFRRSVAFFERRDCSQINGAYVAYRRIQTYARQPASRALDANREREQSRCHCQWAPRAPGPSVSPALPDDDAQYRRRRTGELRPAPGCRRAGRRSTRPAVGVEKAPSRREDEPNPRMAAARIFAARA